MRRLGWLLPKEQRTRPNARVEKDSISLDGRRLTTIVVTLHRFVLAEFNTHRKFSRNSASSRAIPVRKMIERVLRDPAIPLRWASEKPGMQGGEEVGRLERFIAVRIWLLLRLVAVVAVKGLVKIHVHKSVANRLLEPWMWHTIVVTSTEWANFWRQRCSPLAQPEIRAAADEMYHAYCESQPSLVGFGKYHLPFVLDEEREIYPELALCQMSAARCARVSTLNHDGKKDEKADVRLYNRLYEADPMHASPFEHVARPADPLEVVLGNFDGWVQMRHELEAIKYGEKF